MSASPTLRPDAAQFAKIGYFDDIGVKTLNNLDTQFQWDNLQKSQFYKVHSMVQGTSHTIRYGIKIRRKLMGHTYIW